MKRYYMLETNDADKSAELYILVILHPIRGMKMVFRHMDW